MTTRHVLKVHKDEATGQSHAKVSIDFTATRRDIEHLVDGMLADSQSFTPNQARGVIARVLHARFAEGGNFWKPDGDAPEASVKAREIVAFVFPELG